jgi:hypothetical protein
MLKPLIGAIVAATVIALAVYAGIQYMGLFNATEEAVMEQVQKDKIEAEVNNAKERGEAPK